jgi:hypothetical protein
MNRRYRVHKCLFLLTICILVFSLLLAGCGDDGAVVEEEGEEVVTQEGKEAVTKGEQKEGEEKPVSQDEPPTTNLTTPAPAQEGAKQITIIYVEGDNHSSTKEIWLSYYDENDLEWITEKKITDDEGMATFNVPEGESGESYTFTFAFSEAEVNKLTHDIEAGKRMGWRIPPDPLQKKLILKVDGDFKVSVVEGVLQTSVPEF